MVSIQQLDPAPAHISAPVPSSINPHRAIDLVMGRTTSPAVGDLPLLRGPRKGDTRTAVIVFGQGQDKIMAVFAEVLGKSYRLKKGFRDVSSDDQDFVVGIPASQAKADIAGRDRTSLVAIHVHCTNLGMPPDAFLSAQCDYEFLYTEAPFFRRDLSRFISHTLGQMNHHEILMAKPRTYFISTTFPDVHAALPNIDILTVGADAVEIRVDLLKEPLGDGTYAPVPSLSYVGEQVMLLRQRTELPIIFTTRCTAENGRFPMDNPDLYYEYLYRAIQWGVEYIDVEIWLPERIRRKLYEQRGSSRIMSAFHDFSGTFKWPSAKAEETFRESARFADIIKMIAIINDHNENYELEYFRSKIKAEYPDAPPLSAVNMGETGQFSRTLNKVFTPITHPLLPIIAAPGQLSAAEINQALSLLGQLPRKNIYGINTPSSRISTPQAPFYGKCFNELGLPHHFSVVERPLKGFASVEAWCNQKNFGGAYLYPAVPFQHLISNSAFFASINNGTGPILSDSVKLIGMVDTIVVQSKASLSASSAPSSAPSSPGRQQKSDLSGSIASSQSGLPPTTVMVFENAAWKGILSTLTRDFAPSAYFGRAAVVLASNPDDAASSLLALKALMVSKIYTVGFKASPAVARDFNLEPFNSLESMQKARTNGADTTNHDASPFVVVSALAPEKSNLVGMLVRVFGSRSSSATSRKVFLDLADGSYPRKGDPRLIAEQCGFAAYGAEDVMAFTTVETLRLLVGQNVPYSFVRLASGRPMF
ncbi:type I 3-dehydroquinase-domain-containing protein [Sordaria brevicollis]|uniref:Type I 3-dehydroquinase-domain-containing protein n=1 Tax=Sordaria brevicollis TaxID=83679 RepID=A0AAE0P2A5_SORBR|nr:type I 3-dehydroquinase-domain-containing protein [Sordaria brevicollis]